jgi:hypothetical protein
MSLELEYKPDAAEALKRMEAWWKREILDRPTLQVTAPRPERRPLPEKHHATPRDRWMDVEYNVERAAVAMGNTYWAGESLPFFFPNLGPEIMTAALGAELRFGEETSWSEPILSDWSALPELRIDPGNEYLQTILDLTKLSLEVGKGKFLTGHTDLHPGADLAASLRDPQQLCIDLLESPAEVHALMDVLRPTFYQFFDLQHQLMLEAGQAVTISWLPLCTKGRYYIPSNDFCCMISTPQLKEFFLQELIEETEWLDRSIYHMDGPGALRHLDTFLGIPRLGAIQWVWGAGNEPGSRWMDVFRRIQAAGKNIHASVEPWEVDLFMEALDPEGVMLQTWAATPEEADALVGKVRRWRRHQ